MLHAVIMAGGPGTRFWPLSRRSRPKQLLALAGDRPILRATFERLSPLVTAAHTWVVTTAATAGSTRELLPELETDHVLVEPEGRDTAACAGLAAHIALATDPEAVCAMLPSDHVISDEDSFRSALAAAAEVVVAEGGLLTFGVRPTGPETGYGYLEVGPRHTRVGGWPLHRLLRFVEKPDLETARRYLDGGAHLWNSGMFVWRAAELLEELERQLPVLAAGLARIAEDLGTTRETTTLAEVYPTLPRISVDFGVMEGARRCWTIPVDFGWSDVGSWPALVPLLDRDPAGNSTLGRALALDGSGNLLVGDGTLVAAAGIHDLVVVATQDAVLVVPATEAQRVKDLVAELAARGWDDVL